MTFTYIVETSSLLQSSDYFTFWFVSIIDKHSVIDLGLLTSLKLDKII